jgi:hypothetical protein
LESRIAAPVTRYEVTVPGACTVAERLAFQFFLGTGCREREVMFARSFDSRRLHLIFLAFKVSLDSRDKNRGGSLPALDDEYRFVVNDVGFADLL